MPTSENDARDDIADDREDDDRAVRPPGLNQDDNRSATRLELFFDLSLILVFARCAELLVRDPSWSGLVTFTALVALAWWAWTSFTLYANRFDTDDVTFRVAALLAMLALVGVAASSSDISGSYGRWLALSYAAFRLVLAALYLRAWYHVTEARSTIRDYLLAHGVAAVLFAVSALLDTPERFVLWAIALAVELAVPLLATRERDTAPLHVKHLPERYSLLIILVLGESIRGIVVGLEHGHWEGATVVASALAFVVAAGLWWIYFDVTSNTAEKELEAEGESSSPTHDLYLYIHLPIAFGLVLVGVGLDLVVSAAGEHPPTVFVRGLLCAGMVSFFLGAATLQAGMTGKLRLAWPWPTLSAGLAAVVVGISSPHLLLAALGLLVLVTAVGGHRERRRVGAVG